MDSATATAPSAAAFAGTTVFTVPEVVAGEAAVTFAYRQPRTGLWYLLTGPGRGEEIAETMTTMAELLGHDPSLGQLAAMPPGRGAQRGDPQAPWQVFTLAAPAPAPVATDADEPQADRGLALARRRLRLANQAACWAAILGLGVLVLGGFIVLSVRRPEALLGVAANLALGVPTIAVGLWIMVCGIAAGSRGRPLPLVLASLPALAAAVLPIVVPEHPGALVALVTTAWPGLLPEHALDLLGRRWNGIGSEQAVFGLFALGLLWRALVLVVLGRRIAVEERRTA